MVGPAEIVEGIAAGKAAFDSLRAAVGLISDVQKVLPRGEQADAIAVAVRASEQQLKTAEALLAKALGYEICKCEFPPTIMLLAGYRNRDGQQVFECPKCGYDTAKPFAFERTRIVYLAPELEAGA